ncbi:hypothetical protein [Desulfonema magnum]|uniref:Uncharacterized protein n=1 Tax=Desulfonema magnum TaxID=45655 RepID=A0A975BSM2_9BACT|nr:hypothetical protein [Desulfonema magnum]QTA90982.1 Uncharacterized protein dnm_070460 [Desulfonema magnum]
MISEKRILRKTASLYFRTPEPGQKTRFSLFSHAGTRLKKKECKNRVERSGTVFCMRPAKNRFALFSHSGTPDKKTASPCFRTPEPG